MKKVAEKYGVRTVPTALKKLIGLCATVNGDHDRNEEAVCSTRHAKRFVECMKNVV